VPLDLRPTVAASLVFASMTGLLACPQLLSDDFDSALSTDDDSCARRLTCEAGAGGSGGAGGTLAGTAGTPAGTGGSTPNVGGSGPAGAAGSGGTGASAGSSGSGGSGGSGGTGGTGGSGGSDPPDASVEPPDCWSIKLNGSTHGESDNCLDINGWNQVETDPETPDTEVDTTYEDDGVCFTGTIVNEGWGAIYNLTFNDTAPWDAVSRGVGGFELEAVGENLPPQMRVIYSDDDAGDFCRNIIPGGAVQVPFASAHPGCSTSSSSVTDAVDLTHIRLTMLPAASDYAIDFCLGIRAIP
jgi:hypothetical protein